MATGTNIPVGDASYTIETWFKPGIHGNSHFVHWGTAYATNQSTGFRLNPAGLLNYWWGADYNTGTANLADGEWHHAAVTYDGAGRQFYLDGQPIGSKGGATAHNAVWDVVNGLSIGRGNNFGQEYDGLLDEIRIWDRAVPAKQIQTLQSRTLQGLVNQVPGLVGYWDFDNTTGGTVPDESPSGNDGAVQGGAAIVAADNGLDKKPYKVQIDLGDIVGGGTGYGDGVIADGIRPDTGARIGANPGGRSGAPNNYIVIADGSVADPHGYIDGTFVPHQVNPITSAGHTHDFGGTQNWLYDGIRNGVAMQHTNGVNVPMRDADGNVTDVGIGMHSSSGITFDLQAILDDMEADYGPGSFFWDLRFIAGAGNAGTSSAGDVNLHVLLDGVAASGSPFFAQGGAYGVAIDIAIPDGTRFLTLVNEDWDDNHNEDQGYFADAYFCATLAPEPGTLSLLALGGLALLRRRRRA